MSSHAARAAERVIGLRVRMLRTEVEALLEPDDPITERVAEFERFVEAELRARHRPDDPPVPLVNGHGRASS